MSSSPCHHQVTMEEAKADTKTQLEVDIMVLDYLTCNAINALLRARMAERKGQEHNWDATGFLDLSSKFESVFSINHTKTEISQDLAIKLQVLLFANLLIHRYTPEKLFIPLSSAVHEKGVTGKPPLPLLLLHPASNNNPPSYTPFRKPQEPQIDPDRLDGNYSSMLLQLNISPSQNTCPRGELIPLSDIVPHFINLCSLAIAHFSETAWLGLLARLMFQASLEAYLIVGCVSPDRLDEFFAWTPMEPGWAPKWQMEVTKYRGYLQPQTEISPYAHLEKLSKDFPIFQLEDLMIAFLVDLMARLEPPLLIQLERGKLEGLSYAETLLFKDKVGL